MEDRAVVKSGAGQFLEIFDRVRRGVGPELHDHVALARCDYCDFISCTHGTRILLLFFRCK